MSAYADTTLSKYIDNVAVTNGSNTVGSNTALFDARAVTVQAICSNGCAGSLIIESTNQQLEPVNWVNGATLAISANGSATALFTLNDLLTGMHRFRVRFVASSAGNITVAVNIRRSAANH